MNKLARFVKGECLACVAAKRIEALKRNIGYFVKVCKSLPMLT